jgi:hypothetical protein
MASRRRKPGLTPERNREIGAELRAIHDRLVTLAVEVANAYPRASRAGRAADAYMTLGRGMRHIDQLRFALEDELFCVHGHARNHWCSSCWSASIASPPVP